MKTIAVQFFEERLKDLIQSETDHYDLDRAIHSLVGHGMQISSFQDAIKPALENVQKEFTEKDPKISKMIEIAISYFGYYRD